MTPMRAASGALLAACIGLACLPSAATAQTENPAFKSAVASAIEGAIIPGYQALAVAADAQSEAMARLCAAPAEITLAEARTAFGELLIAFARVEMYRFGPARADNRFERLLFWPDRRGRGLKQVQRLIATEDETAIDVGTLQGKSVAMQGLLALEFVLFGTGGDALATVPTGYRCRYGAAIAGAIADTSRAIADDWSAPDGHAALMQDAGPDNPVYRSHGDGVQVLLQAAREQLQIVRDLKLGNVLRQSPETARPKASPFWRSGLPMQAVAANIAGVETLFKDGGLHKLAPLLSDELAFELTQARRAVLGPGEGAEDLAASLADADRYQQLAYATLPLGGAIDILSQRFPDALNLVLGFNSLDGD